MKTNSVTKRSIAIRKAVTPFLLSVFSVTVWCGAGDLSTEQFTQSSSNSAWFNYVHAEPSEAKKTKRVPAMRDRVYSQLARAQEIADQGNIEQGFDVLDDVKERLSNLNSYERAMLFNFYGFMHYGNDNLDKAIENFELVVAEQDGISDALFLSTQYSLVQLYMQQQRFDDAEAALLLWEKANPKPLTSDQYALFAQISYQKKDYQGVVNSIDKAINVASQEKGYTKDSIKENWLILKRAGHYELKQPEKVTAVLEDMVRFYNKDQYWIQLAGMYGETGQEKKQLAVMEAAYYAGFIQQETELMTLAQLYVYHQLPFKAATLLQKSIDSGALVATENRLELLAQSYIMAKEDQKALPVLILASKISNTGKFDAQLAQVYVNAEMWELAIDSADRALERNNIDNKGNMHLAKGMSYFNLKKFGSALLAFAQAKQVEKTEKTANQWFKYVEMEQGYQAQLAQNVEMDVRVADPQ